LKHNDVYVAFLLHATYRPGPRNRRPGQHLIISDVKKGSVAHRSVQVFCEFDL